MTRVAAAAWAVLVCSASIRAEPRATADTVVILPVEVNGVKCGDSRAIVRNETDVLIAVDDLRACDVIAKGPLRTVEGISFLSLNQATPRLKWNLNADDLVLYINTVAQAFAGRLLDLRLNRLQVPLARWEPAAALSYAMRWSDHGIPTSFFDLTASTPDGPFNQTATLSHARGFVRGSTSMNIDHPKKLRRITLGDALVNSGDLGGAAFVGGVTMRRNTALEPGTPVRPGLFHSDALETPSTLDVYVQDRLVAQRELSPGPFSVVTTPGLGMGGARYVIRDALGNQREITQTYYGASGVLADGYSDYSYSVGALRENMSEKSFDYTMPALLARYRIGVTDWFTFGLRSEFLAAERFNTGLSLAFGTPYAEFGVSGAVSAQAGVGNGFAAAFTASHVQRRVRLDTSLRLVGSDYANVSLSGDDERALVQAAARGRVAVGRTAGVALEGVFLDLRDGGINRRVTLSGDWFTRARVALRAQVGIEDFDQQDPVFSCSLVAAFRLDGLTMLSSSASVRDSDEEFALDLSRAAGVGPGLSGRVRGATGTNSELLAQLRADTPWLRAEFDGNWSTQREDDVRGGIVGSIVYIDKSIHAARPVGSGYALVRTPNLTGVRVLHNRMKVGTTDWRGALIVPQLFPYNASYVSVDPDDIPLNRVLDRDGQYVKVPFGGATTLKFAEKILIVVRGRLVLESGKPVPAGGDAQVAGDSGISSPVGNDGYFEFIDLVPGSYQLEVQYPEGRCTAHIQVKANESEAELGEVRCAPGSSSSP